jgi:hypothetical protein
VARAVLAFGLGHALHLQPESDVAQNGRPRHQREILEDEGALGAGSGDRLSLDQYLAGARLKKTRHDFEKRGLSAARRPEKASQLARFEGEVDAVQRDHFVAIDLADAAHFDDGIGDRLHGRGWRRIVSDRKFHFELRFSGRNRIASTH